MNSIQIAGFADYAWKFGSFDFQLQNNLFYSASSSSGQIAVDLLATNVNRGRDHGLQPYVKYVQACLGINITQFNDLATSGLMNQVSVTNLAKVYAYVYSI